ncbi:MAG: tetratricopeptide repeat protein [Gemmatimonadota bacterium]|nr:MAG: tetratricopeptide repeat protein [Gemmatimonadota bacterium]
MAKQEVVRSVFMITCVLLLIPFLSPCVSSMNVAKDETSQEQVTEPTTSDSLQRALHKKYYSQLYEYWKNQMWREALEPGRKMCIDAIEPGKKAIEIDPKYKSAYYYLADCYVRLAELDSAQRVYERGLEVDSENKYFHRGLAYVLLAKGLEEEAISEYEIVVEQFPEESSYNLTLAKLYINQENDEGAIREFERASETDLKKREAWIEARDKILDEKGGEDPQVIQYNQQIEQIDGQIRDELSTLEILYKRNDMVVNLVDVYLKYLRLNPEDTQAKLNLGKQYYDIGEHEKTEEVLTELVEMDPGNVEAYFYLGRCCLSMGKSREAIDAYKKVIELEPDNIKGYAELASAYNEIGQPDAAERNVKKAINLDPDYGYARVVYGEIYEKRATPHIDKDGRVKLEWARVFEKAVEQFAKAKKDPEWKAYAEGKIEYLSQFLPTDEQKFFEEGKKPNK